MWLLQRSWASGICTSGGNILYAAADDHRVRALVTVAGFFGQPHLVSTLFGADGVESRKAAGRQARELYRETGGIETIKAYLDTEPAASKPPKDFTTWINHEAVVFARGAIPLPSFHGTMARRRPLELRPACYKKIFVCCHVYYGICWSFLTADREGSIQRV